MSEGGTGKAQEQAYKRDLAKRLKVLAPKPGQVILLEMPGSFFATRDDEKAALVQRFAQDVAKATNGTPVFVVPEGTIRAIDDPREKAPPDITVAKSKIILPSGIRPAQ